MASYCATQPRVITPVAAPCPWQQTCSTVRFVGPATTPPLVAGTVQQQQQQTAQRAVQTAIVPVVPVQTTTTTAVHTHAAISRQRWIAALLALAAALLLLALVVWAWLRDRCRSDSDCGYMCPDANTPCASRCSGGKCQRRAIACNQPGQAWCAQRRACIDTRTDVCNPTSGFLPVTPVVPPSTPSNTNTGGGGAPSGTVPPTTPAQPGGGSPHPLGAMQANAGSNSLPPASPLGTQTVPVQPDMETIALLVPLMSQCSPHAAGPQTVSADGRTYYIDAHKGSISMVDASGRVWARGCRGRWWHFDSVMPLSASTNDGNSSPASPTAGAAGYNGYVGENSSNAPGSPQTGSGGGGGGAGASINTVTCWDEAADLVWMRDSGNSLWVSPREGSAGWMACDDTNGGGHGAPPASIDAGSAIRDVAACRSSAVTALSAAVARSPTTSPAV